MECLVKNYLNSKSPIICIANDYSFPNSLTFNFEENTLDITKNYRLSIQYYSSAISIEENFGIWLWNATWDDLKNTDDSTLYTGGIFTGIYNGNPFSQPITSFASIDLYGGGMIRVLSEPSDAIKEVTQSMNFYLVIVEENME